MSKRIPSLTARKLIRAFKKAGYTSDEGREHTLLSKEGHPHILAVPRHKGDLGRGLVRSLVDASDLSVEEFLRLL